MVGTGSWMVLMGLLGILFYKKGTLEQNPWYLKLLIPTLFFPYIANTAGWIMAEMGRQPWIVYGLQTVESAVSPNVTSGMILTSLVGFTLIYAIFIIADVYLLQKYARSGPDNPVVRESLAHEEVSLWS